MLKLMYITNDPAVGQVAESCGVDRIWIDLETMGKAERQGDIDSVKSQHKVCDIARMKKVLSDAQLLVRVNPWNSASPAEIESVISAGADLVMLPMWKTVDEVRSFIEAVNNRCRTILLLETKEAVACLESVLSVPGVDEVHIGLNDLHLSYGLDFMFELLVNDVVEDLCGILAKSQIPYGVGGIARLGHGKVPAELIVPEHYRLGSTRVILSRSFCDYSKEANISEVEAVFKQGIGDLRKLEIEILGYKKEDYDRNRGLLKAAVKNVAQERALGNVSDCQKSA